MAILQYGANGKYWRWLCNCSFCNGDVKVIAPNGSRLVITPERQHLTLDEAVQSVALNPSRGNGFDVITVSNRGGRFFLNHDPDGITIIQQKLHIHDTLDDAAMDAADHIYKKSSEDENQGNEYGVTIYEKGNKFYLTEMKLGLGGQISPDNYIVGGYTYVAYVHSHPKTDTTGQTFSLTDYINCYSTRIGKDLKGITGYLVSHIGGIEFIKNKNCVWRVGQHCEICLIDDPRRGPREECKICPEQCKECTKIEGGNEGKELKMALSRGALMKFTPPPVPAENILPAGHSVIDRSIEGRPRETRSAPKGCRAVNGNANEKTVPVDEKLKEWKNICGVEQSDAEMGENECLKSRRLRRCLFRAHVEVTGIVAPGGPTEWFSGKHIIFPGR